MHLSVVIPAYNEAHRICGTLHTLVGYLKKQAYEWEIIIVDDGSEDGTGAVVQESFPELRLIPYKPNRGKGHAVKTGILAAQGAYRLYYDADGSTPIDELEKAWPKFEAGADIVIGSRALAESRIEVAQPWFRRNLGRVYNLMLRALSLTPYPDTQCGFKVLTARAAELLFPRVSTDRFGFEVELLYLAGLRGLRVEQIPVRWIDSPESRVRLVYDSWRMLLDAMRLRLRTLAGKHS